MDRLRWKVAVLPSGSVTATSTWCGPGGRIWRVTKRPFGSTGTATPMAVTVSPGFTCSPLMVTEPPPAGILRTRRLDWP